MPIILAIGLAAGILIGATFSKPAVGEKMGLEGSIAKFKEVLTLIERNYVDEVDVDELVEGAIVEMLDELDPHSTYIPASEKVRANEGLQGNFEGIGVEFNIFKDTIVVISPLGGGPSEAVGVMAGDKIIKVDGETVAGVGFTTLDVQRTLKGPKGTKVKISVKRKGVKDLIEFEITRDKIPQYSVDTGYMIDDETGYIKISRFGATTFLEFKEKLLILKDKGMERLILDLQGNPGGYMSAAIQIADEFLPDDRKIVYTKGKEFRFNTEANTESEGEFEDGALIVLMNEGSASASEIVAGALQDNDRALIVGRRSFGKGLVQLPMDLSDGSEMRLTISRYYTPSGRSIQKPYGDVDYERDISKRFSNGEFFSADSVKFVDSLKFKTRKSRTVYGGGGIMPDYFVPLDTTQGSAYLNRLYYSNAMLEFAFRYFTENEKALSRWDYQDYYDKFPVTPEMEQRLMDIGESYKVERNSKELSDNRELFHIHMKSQIARRVWGNDGFYPIFNLSNEILENAIKLWSESEELDRSKF